MSNFGGDQAVSASHPFVFEVDAGGSCHRLNTSFLHYYYYFSGGKKKEGVGEGGDERVKGKTPCCYFGCIFESCFSARI